MDNRTVATRFEQDGHVSIPVAWVALGLLTAAGWALAALLGLVLHHAFDVPLPIAVLAPGLLFTLGFGTDVAPWLPGSGPALHADATGLVLRHRTPIRIPWAGVRQVDTRVLGRGASGLGGRTFLEITWREESGRDRRLLLPRVFAAPYDELVEWLTAPLGPTGPLPAAK